MRRIGMNNNYMAFALAMVTTLSMIVSGCGKQEAAPTQDAAGEADAESEQQQMQLRMAVEIPGQVIRQSSHRLLRMRMLSSIG